MKLPLFPVFFLAASLLCSPGEADEPAPAGPGNINLQVTTFKVTGMALPLSLLDDPTSGDEALFQRLAAMVAEGGAELLSDQHSTVPAVKGGTVEAIKETPFPSDWTPLRRPWELLPKEFQNKNGGISVRAQLDFLPAKPPEPKTAGISGSLGIESIRTDHLTQIPVSLPQAAEDGIFNYPQFLTEDTNAVFRTADSAHHLVSVCLQAGETVPANDGWCFTFAKASPQIPGGKTAASRTALRLHALTFRLPVAEGREFLQLHAAGNDAGLLEALLKAKAGKKAELVHFAALLAETAANPFPSVEKPADPAGETGEPEQPDPFAAPTPGSQGADFQPFTMAPSESYAASLEVIEEYPFATEYSDELLPTGLELKNLGRSFQISVIRPMSGSGAQIAVHLQHLPAPDMTSWPEIREGERGYRTFCPSFSQTTLSTTLTVRAGGVYCLGALTLPEYFKGQRPELPLMEISLLQAASLTDGQNPVPAISRTQPPPELEAEVFSLSASDAARLETRRNSTAEAEALLAETTENGSARSLAFCLVPGDPRSKPEIGALVETALPLDGVWTKTHRLLATEIEFYNVGFSLRAAKGEPPVKDETFLNFQHFGSTMVQPTDAELKKAADGKGKLPEPRRFVIESNIAFHTAPFQLLSLAPAKVPAGHPEEGRWHAAVLRCRNQ